jgi:hypothetical protein
MENSCGAASEVVLEMLDAPCLLDRLQNRPEVAMAKWEFLGWRAEEASCCDGN